MESFRVDRAQIGILTRWLEIRDRYGHHLTTLSQLKADIDHSALLERLLSGREPFPEPPPRAFSYPWYELVEDGRSEALEAQLIEQDGGLFPKGTLIIDQAPWVVLETLGPDSWIVTYEFPNEEYVHQKYVRPMEPPTVERYVRATSRWKVYSPGPHPKIPERKQWVIERV